VAAAVLITALTVVALPVMLYLALQLPPSPLRGHRAAWDTALAAAALAIWLEPVHSTLFYGQVDVFIACAVPWASRFSPPPPPISGTSPSCGPGGSARPRTPRIRACSAR